MKEKVKYLISSLFQRHALDYLSSENWKEANHIGESSWTWTLSKQRWIGNVKLFAYEQNQDTSQRIHFFSALLNLSVVTQNCSHMLFPILWPLSLCACSLLTQECPFHLSCSSLSYLPSRTMPPLIFLPEVDFCVCLHVALCCGVFRKSPVYNLSQVPLEACHGAWYITGAQKKWFFEWMH